MHLTLKAHEAGHFGALHPGYSFVNFFIKKIFKRVDDDIPRTHKSLFHCTLSFECLRSLRQFCCSESCDSDLQPIKCGSPKSLLPM